MSISGIHNPNYKTGFLVPGNESKFYNSWQAMKQRCLNPNSSKYPRYGGRGITVCEDWKDIRGFMDWAYKNGYKEGLTIDRIDIDGNYESSNCRWVTRSENSSSKSTNKLSEDQRQQIKLRSIAGENRTKLAKEFGVTRQLIYQIWRKCLVDSNS